MEKMIFWAKFIQTVYFMYEHKPTSLPKGWKLVKHIYAEAAFGPYKEKELIGIVVKSILEPKQYAFVFHGTESAYDFIDDFEFSFAEFDLIKNGGKTEYGFTRFYESIYFADENGENPVNRTDYLKELPKDSNFIIAGHSLGGAIATLHAAVLAERNFLVEAITYASPMAGNETFVKRYNTLVPKSLRIVNNADIVPKLPGKFLGYKHVDTLYEINSLVHPELKYNILSLHSIETYLYLLESEAK